MKFNAIADRCIRRGAAGAIAGGVIYSDYTGESALTSVAGSRSDSLSRCRLWAGLGSPLNQRQVQRAVARSAADNPLSLAFNGRLGFSPVAYIPGVYRGNVAMVVTRLERADCRWLKLGSRYQTKDNQDG